MEMASKEFEGNKIIQQGKRFLLTQCQELEQPAAAQDVITIFFTTGEYAYPSISRDLH